MAIRKMAAPSRIPNMNVANGSQAVMGIGRRPCTSGSSRSRTFSNHPISTPTVMPAIEAIAKPTKTRHALSQTYSNQVPEYQANVDRGPKIHCHQASRTAAGEGTKLGSTQPAEAAYCHKARSSTGSKARQATPPSEPADNTRPEQTPRTRMRLVAIAHRVVSIHRGCSSFMSKNACYGILPRVIAKNS